jgi:hypothetical protein
MIECLVRIKIGNFADGSYSGLICSINPLFAQRDLGILQKDLSLRGKTWIQDLLNKK